MRPSISAEIMEILTLLQHLKEKRETVILKWIPGHCKIYGNEQADMLAKKGAMVLEINNKNLLFHSAKLYIQKSLYETYRHELAEQPSAKSWKEE